LRKRTSAKLKIWHPIFYAAREKVAARATLARRPDMTARKTPKVSIGFPVYNAEETVTKAIQGFLEQDFEDFELIISDNASTDGTHQTCASFARTDARIRLERQPHNIGANRNFDYVLSRAQGELFMWAAHDDYRDPSFIWRCVEALAAEPKAVLAAPNVRLVYPHRNHSDLFAYSDEVTHSDVVRRLRWVLRAGAWFAIYGLIRRAALARTRSMASLEPMPAPGLGSDYRVVELALLGPFVPIQEPLLEYQMREPESAEVLAGRLDPHARFSGTMFWWWLKDVWRMSARHRFDLGSRLRIQAEYIASTRSPGSLHHEFLRYNSEFLSAARQNRRWLKATNLFIERCIIDGVRNALRLSGTELK
jgi:glycosyltransferase involved in cell wall biosynthesis